MTDDARGEARFDGVTRGEFLKLVGAAGALVTASGGVVTLVGNSAGAQTIGNFGPLFVEPVIYVPRSGGGFSKVSKPSTAIAADCVERENSDGQTLKYCKPAAGQNGLLPDGRFLYMDALGGTENNERIVFDADEFIQNSQSRVLTINYGNNKDSRWLRPKEPDGGVDDETPSETIPGATISDDRQFNDGDFFCSHQIHLPNGCLLVVGGTHWYQEGANTPEDPLELEGMQAARFFDYKLDKWVQLDRMGIGRWYPAVVALANGDPLVFGGVHKLVKPVYTPPQEEDEPAPRDSGGNVREVERFSLETGKWQDQGELARNSLPLMPRMHLLPSGNVSYNGAGQAFNPLGEDKEQPTWNFVATYDPEKRQWFDEGTLAGTGSSLPASKLSTTEVPLLLEPDGAGNYTKYEILNGGGTSSLVAAGHPGSFFPNNHSRIDTFDTTKAPGDPGYYSSADTDTMFAPPPAPDAPDESELREIAGEAQGLASGALDAADLPELPASFGFGRWYGDAVLLPDGTVFVSGGGDRDEVFFPGNEFPVRECELFDRNDTSDHPNGSWKVVGEMDRDRTYHNTNSLLPTGQVIIGGHAPIPFGYVSHDSDVLPESRNEDGRDPTFQIWDPPYISDPNRPSINVRDNGTKRPLNAAVGERLSIPTSNGPAIEDVVLMRIPSTTHINDTEQRGLVLKVLNKNGNRVVARMPKTLAELGGPGFYLAFVRNARGVPSEGVFVKVPNRGQVYPSFGGGGSGDDGSLPEL